MNEKQVLDTLRIYGYVLADKKSPRSWLKAIKALSNENIITQVPYSKIDHGALTPFSYRAYLATRLNQ